MRDVSGGDNGSLGRNVCRLLLIAPLIASLELHSASSAAAQVSPTTTSSIPAVSEATTPIQADSEEDSDQPAWLTAVIAGGVIAVFTAGFKLAADNGNLKGRVGALESNPPSNGGGGSVSRDWLEARLQLLEAKLEGIDNRIETTHSRIEIVRSDSASKTDNLASEIRNIRGEVEGLRSDINIPRIDSRIAELDAKLRELNDPRG